MKMSLNALWFEDTKGIVLMHCATDTCFAPCIAWIAPRDVWPGVGEVQRGVE